MKKDLEIRGEVKYGDVVMSEFEAGQERVTSVCSGRTVS